MNYNKKRARDMGFYALILVIILATVFTMNMEQAPAEMPYSDVLQLFYDEKVESFQIEGTTLYLTLHEPDESGKDKITTELYSVNYFKQDLDELIKEQYADGIITDYDYDVGFVLPWWVSLLP